MTWLDFHILPPRPGIKQVSHWYCVQLEMKEQNSVRSIKVAMKSAVNGASEKSFQETLLAYPTKSHATTKKTPFEMILSHRTTTELNQPWPSVSQAVLNNLSVNRVSMLIIEVTPRSLSHNLELSCSLIAHTQVHSTIFET